MFTVDEENEKNDELDGYILKERIGSGSFSIVYTSTNLHNQKNYAVKVINKERVFGDALDRLLRESKLLKSISHPNIISLFDVKCK